MVERDSLDCCCVWFFFFFFQAEDGIRDYKVTGVQTCALPISGSDSESLPVDGADSDALEEDAAALTQANVMSTGEMRG